MMLDQLIKRHAKLLSDLMRYFLFLAPIFFALSAGKKAKYFKNKKPNIIFVLADDIGWNEVSWHNEKIKTPFMEVKLNIQ